MHLVFSSEVSQGNVGTTLVIVTKERSTCVNLVGEKNSGFFVALIGYFVEMLISLVNAFNAFWYFRE